MRFSGVAAAALVLLGFSLACPVSSAAKELAYTVRSGQSLTSICLEIYGDKDLYFHVAFFNGKEDPRRIAPGETLRMPFSDMVTLRKGESLSGLAKRVWGDAKKYPVIAWANGIRDPARIPAGTRLVVPVLIPYRLAKGESVSSAAGRFYGDPKQYAPIIAASGIEDPLRVRAGSVLKVPYVFPRPAVNTVPGKSKKVVSVSASDKAMTLLGQAEADFRGGKYGEAWTAGHEAARGLEGKEKARAMRLLAVSQYAFGKTVEALEHLKSAYELEPGFSPDPAYVNPEMMRLYERARGK